MALNYTASSCDVIRSFLRRVVLHFIMSSVSKYYDFMQHARLSRCEGANLATNQIILIMSAKKLDDENYAWGEKPAPETRG